MPSALKMRPCLVYDDQEGHRVTRYRHPVSLRHWTEYRIQDDRVYTRHSNRWSWEEGIVRVENDEWDAFAGETAELYMRWPCTELPRMSSKGPRQMLLQIRLADGTEIVVTRYDGAWHLVEDDLDANIRRLYRLPADMIDGKKYAFRPLTDPLDGQTCSDWNYWCTNTVCLKNVGPTHVATRGSDLRSVHERTLPDGRTYMYFLKDDSKWPELTILENPADMSDWKIVPYELDPRIVTADPVNPSTRATESVIRTMWSMSADPPGLDGREMRRYRDVYHTVQRVVHAELLPLLSSGKVEAKDGMWAAKSLMANVKRNWRCKDVIEFDRVMPIEILRVYITAMDAVKGVAPLKE